MPAAGNRVPDTHSATADHSLSATNPIRFGAFELDLRAGELRKDGLKIKLQGQPIQVLAALLEHRGEIVMREELRQRLWPSDTFVDFEHNLNSAVKRLREALGDSADKPRFIETLPRHGYRFIGPVIQQRRDVRRPQVLLRAMWIAALAVVTVVGLVLGLNLGEWRQRVLGRAHTTPIQSLAVLPLENLSGKPEEEYFADGMTEELITELGKIHHLRVISRQSVMHYKGTDKPLPQIANELRVEALIQGSALRAGNRVRITMQLIRAVPEEHLWAESYERDVRDVIDLQREVANDITAQIRITLGPQEQMHPAQKRLTKPTQSPEAYELYLKGRYYWNRRTGSDIRTAISYFNKAIAKDPTCALAYSGLADAYIVLPTYGGTPTQDYPRANAAARKALELDPTLAHAHAVLGFSEMVYDWDYAGGETEFKKAFELDPNDASAHIWHANIVGSLGGREQEARAESQRALQLDPLSSFIRADAADYYGIDEAIALCEKLAAEDPTFAKAHRHLAEYFWAKRMYLQAIKEWKIYGQLARDRNQIAFAFALEQGFHHGGWKGALVRAIAVLKAQRQIGYSSAYGIARLYAELGNKDQAFRWLNIAYQERDLNMSALKATPAFASIDSDPRFAELVHKVGLPQ